ncbi:MAG: hypothetical protein VX505_07915 [Chloroflexota bacterium]|nr:hypothetical protein [Chloroflexota bacterium]
MSTKILPGYYRQAYTAETAVALVNQRLDHMKSRGYHRVVP